MFTKVTAPFLLLLGPSSLDVLLFLTEGQAEESSRKPPTWPSFHFMSLLMTWDCYFLLRFLGLQPCSCLIHTHFPQTSWAWLGVSEHYTKVSRRWGRRRNKILRHWELIIMKACVWTHGCSFSLINLHGFWSSFNLKGSVLGSPDKIQARLRFLLEMPWEPWLRELGLPLPRLGSIVQLN